MQEGGGGWGQGVFDPDNLLFPCDDVCPVCPLLSKHHIFAYRFLGVHNPYACLQRAVHAFGTYNSAFMMQKIAHRIDVRVSFLSLKSGAIESVEQGERKRGKKEWGVGRPFFPAAVLSRRFIIYHLNAWNRLRDGYC